MQSAVTSYILIGIQLLIGGTLILWLSVHSTILLALSLVICTAVSVPYILLYLTEHRETSEPDSTSDYTLSELQLFTDELSESHGLGNITVHKTDEQAGQVQRSLTQNHTMYVPIETNPEEATQESKAVIAHECAHLHYNDGIRYSISRAGLIGTAGLCINISFQIGLVATVLTIGLIVFCFPAILHYLKHRAEYRADDFAIEHTSEQAVSHRLRRNALNVYQPACTTHFPYLLPHPQIGTRISRVHQTSIDTQSSSS